MPEDLQGGTANTEPAQGTGSASKPAETQAAPPQAKPEAAPEKYEFKLPEGVSLDDEVSKQFEAVVRENKLPAEKAQALLDLATKQILGQQAEAVQRWTEQRQSWVQELQRDQEFGGGRFNETITRAQRSLAKFGSPALKDFLDKSGYGDNSELIKLLAKVDRALGEDKLVDGGNAGETVDVASLLYPSATKR